MDFIPVNFTPIKRCNEISKSDSLIFVENNSTYITYNNTIYQWDSSFLTEIITLPNKITAILNLSVVGMENGVVKINESYHKLSTKKITNIVQYSNNIYFTSDSQLIIYDSMQEIFIRKGFNAFINAIAVNECIFLGCADKTLKILKNDSLIYEMALTDEIKQLVYANDLFIGLKNKIIKLNLTNYEQSAYKIKEITKIFYNGSLFILSKKGLQDLSDFVYKKSNKFYNFIVVDDSVIFLGKNEIVTFKKPNEIKSFYYHESKIKQMKHFNNLFTMSDHTIIEWEDKVIKNVYEFDKEVLDFFVCYDTLYVLKEGVIEGINLLSREIKFNFEGNFTSFYAKDGKLYTGENNILKVYEIFGDKAKLINEFDFKDDISLIQVSSDKKYLAVVTAQIIHVVLLPKKKLFSLYGHSLPIKDVIFHNDMIFSYSMDKTVKIYGLDFGECIKSITLCDAGPIGKISIFDEYNWLVASNHLIHIEKYEIKKVYQEKCNLISINSNSVVISDGYSVIFMKEGDFYDPELKINQLIKEEEVANPNEYEMFIDNLENSLLNLDVNLGELEKYIEMLNTYQVKALIDQIKNVNNLILKVRIINLLCIKHKEILLGNEVFDEQMNDAYEQMKALRREVNRNYYFNK